MEIKLLAVGDVVGRPGMDFLSRRLPALIKTYQIAFTVVNGENADGLGLLPAQAEELFRAGADVVTLGNHTWNKRDIMGYLDECPRILRPANFAPQVPGRGLGIFDTQFGRVAVLSLIGRCGMDFGPDNPFHAADRLLAGCDAPIRLVDMHAEATSEKLAMAHYLDGRVSAVWGTHTHVQTSDWQVLPKGTGCITDLGMTGPIHSVLGIRPADSIWTFLGNPRRRYEVASGDCKLECAVFTIDADTGKCGNVEGLRIQ